MPSTCKVLGLTQYCKIKRNSRTIEYRRLNIFFMPFGRIIQKKFCGGGQFGRWISSLVVKGSGPKVNLEPT